MIKRSFNIIYLCRQNFALFKKETEYAMRALVYIQRCNLNRRRPGIAEISSETETPQPFIAKILHKLVKQRVLESIKGKGGGFFFDPDRPALSLKSLIVLFEGDSIFTDCGFGMKQCVENHPCPLHVNYSALRTDLNNLAEHETIQSLARSSGNDTYLGIVKLSNKN
jgi:Rrf2 family protein